MFQTFSGSSRRPRQVNLSGQTTNPFAANSWNSSTSGTQKTIALAQQERLLRQQERERLNATKRIQRVWRGHRTRRQLADARRRSWDELEVQNDTESTLVQQIQLLVTFFNPKKPKDLARLVSLGSKISACGHHTILSCQDIQSHLVRLADVTLEALQSSLPGFQPVLLELLLAAIKQNPHIFDKISRIYFGYLSALISSSESSQLQKNGELLLTAIKSPLTPSRNLGSSHDVLGAYSAFALNFLTTPNLANLLSRLDEVAAVIDISKLSSALIRDFTIGSVDHIQSEVRLWLLAHFISLNRLQGRTGQGPEFIRALSLQLSSSSGDIVARIDASDAEVIEVCAKSDEVDKSMPALPIFIEEELLSLVNQSSISGLLEKFNVDNIQASAASEEDASLLASYALTLLRIFPRRGDEIRMWLYRGSMNTLSGTQLPALKFFWQAMSSTNTYSTIRSDPKAALTLLRNQTQQQAPQIQSNGAARDRDWRTILLFLELYTFVLRFTDDEEFFSGDASSFTRKSESISSFQQSALPLDDVKQLTIFLKNLAFTAYFNAGELTDGGKFLKEGGIGSYFGANATPPRFQSPMTGAEPKSILSMPFAGIAGMTFNYMRTIVTGVMRMLYQRDSRRRFLPADHWLMTSRFEMDSFIPAVVMEEESQHQLREEGEEADADADADADLDIEQAGGRELGLVGMARPRRAIQIENMRRQQAKVQRQKLLTAVGPRLEVLQNMPFVIPFKTRVQIFREFVHLDQLRRRGGHVDPDHWRMFMFQQSHMARQASRLTNQEILARHHAKIRRDQVFEDAYDQFYELGEGLKEPIQITFVDQFGSVEAGIDGGGVTKEFLTSVTQEAFRTGDGPNLFVTNDQNLLYPNPAALDERRELMRQAGLKESSADWWDTINQLLRRYEFLGRVVGKCLYEGFLVDIGFAGFFLLEWAAYGTSGSESGYRANINDLRDLDEGLYQGLLKLKNYPGDVEDFALDFTITDRISPPGAPIQTITRELMPNGSNMTVSNENRPLYVSCVALHRLQTQPRLQTQAFLRGLSEIVKPSWLSMFNQSELQTLIGGDSSDLDVEDLRSNTQYGGVYQIGDDGEEHPTVKLFWKVLKKLDDQDRRKVVKYVTSTPRAPLLGFSQLNPRFSIRDAGDDEDRLPSTSTCVNLLKLPRYSTERKLREKLLYAVNSGAGFDLS